MDLNKIIEATNAAYNATLENRTARTQANAAAATSQAQAAQSSNFAKIAMIGGGLLLVVVVGLFLFRRK